MNENRIHGRIANKHDTQANWLKAVNFTPMVGELIIYDPDSEHDTARVKVGDGETNVNALPFVSGVANAIIDAASLPEENIQENAFYRMQTCAAYYNGVPQTAWTCYIVETLPETGEMAYDGTNAFVYYNQADGIAYGYVNSIMSAQLGVPSGWYDGAVLVPAIGQLYGGIIGDASDMTEDDTLYLLLEYTLYTYERGKWKKFEPIGWTGIGSGSEIFNSRQNKAYGPCSHAEGFRTMTGRPDSVEYGNSSHAEGHSSHAEGYSSHAEGNGSHAEGNDSHAEGSNSHAEGYSSHAEGGYSHAEGHDSHAEGNYSHAEGGSSHAEGRYSHAEGNNSHAEGCGSHAEGDSSHAEGDGKRWSSLLTGEANATTYTAFDSLPSEIEVGQTVRMQRYGDEAGNEVGCTYSTAKIVSFDAQNKTITLDRTLSDIAVTNMSTIGYYSGMAIGDYSHKEGNQGIALGRSQHVQGEYNVVDPNGSRNDLNARGKYAHIVGNGSSHTDRSNAYALDWYGNAYHAGDVYVLGNGVNDFAGAKKLATEELVKQLISALGLPTPTAADAGKILCVNAEGKYELSAFAKAEEATF